MNIRSAFLHLLGDVGTSLAAVGAGLGIRLTGATWLDPAAGAVFAVLIILGSWHVLRDSVEILLEGTPRDVHMPALVADLSQIAGVLGVHDLHVWSLSGALRTMSAHVLTDKNGLQAGDRIRREIGAMLQARYSIRHATLQLECEGCEPATLYCDLDEDSHKHSVSG